MIEGMFRGDNGNKIVSHLYSGDYSNPGFPYCSNGWNRKYFDKKGKLVDWEYSIFRGNKSEAGTCFICQRRYLQGKPPVEIPKAKYNPKNENHHITN